MVRTAVADERLFSYFTKLSKQDSHSVGLVLGQSVSGRDYVIHFAKTPHESKPTKNLGDFNEDWVADHARQATRMLPGGMFVLGVFVVSPEDILNPFSAKVKGILSRIFKNFEQQKYLFGNPSGNERLALSYCTQTQQLTCKSYDVVTGGVKPAEFKFLSGPLKWVQVECKYYMDQVYPIGDNETDWPLNKHMGIILDTMNKNLKNSVYLYDGELKEGEEAVDSFDKKKIPRNSKSSASDETPKPLHVCIMQPQDSAPSPFKISDTSNQLRIFGNIVTKLWLSPKSPINSASEAVLHDIMRSLSTRFEMHWDSLTEEEHGEDVNSIHEPPRRVLIPLPESSIEISDYLFPGEGPQDAKSSLEELLAVNLKEETDVLDVEGQADLTEYYNEALESDAEDAVPKKQQESHKSMLYYIGLGVALLVLIISLVIHFLQSR